MLSGRSRGGLLYCPVGREVSSCTAMDTTLVYHVGRKVAVDASCAALLAARWPHVLPCRPQGGLVHGPVGREVASCTAL